MYEKLYQKALEGDYDIVDCGYYDENTKYQRAGFIVGQKKDVGYRYGYINYNAQEMLDTIRYAYTVFSEHKRAWEGIVKRAMQEDFSWNVSAKQYEKLYTSLL